MDLATLIGLLMWVVLVIMGMGLGTLGLFVDFPSVQITVGGSLGATILSQPLSAILSIGSVTKNAIFLKPSKPGETVNMLVKFAEQARREGILALESAAQEIEDEFLKKGVQLAVDGTEPELIKDILSTEIAFIEERHGAGAKVWDAWGALAPAFGMIGTLIGLIKMLANLNDPSTIGPSMAVALITTLYGAIIANGICIPLADKLKKYSSDEILIKELMLEGIMSLQSGDNPRIVQQKLAAFLAPGDRVDLDNK